MKIILQGHIYRSLVAVIVSISFIAMTAIGAMAQTTLSQVQDAYHRAQGQIVVMDQKLRLLGLKEETANHSWTVLKMQVAVLSSEQKHMYATLVRIQYQGNRDKKKLQRVRGKVQMQRQLLRKLLVIWYEEGAQPFLDTLLSSKSLSDLYNRYVALSLVTKQQQHIENEAKQEFVYYHALTIKVNQEAKQVALLWQALANKKALARSQTTKEHSIVLQLANLKQQSVAKRTLDRQMVQRLASKIAALQQRIEEQRIREEQQRAKAQQNAASGTPTIVGTLPSVSLQQDLGTAAKDAGVPSSWVSWLSVLAMAESGGNPNAKSPFVVQGEQASGLMQMLPSTFSQYAESGHTDIWNPTDNAIAAIRYIEANYGAPWHIPGIGTSSYQGY